MTPSIDPMAGDYLRPTTPSPSRSVFSRGLLLAAWETIVALLILLAMFDNAIQENAFFGDESQWIYTSQCFEPFLTANVHSPVWAPSYWTFTQPPLARYFIGLGRWIGGFGIKDLNQPWDFSIEENKNIEQNHKPSVDLLWWSRLPMGILAIVSCLIWFRLIRVYAGYLAGWILLWLLADSVYLRHTLFMATSEAPLFFCVTVAAWAGIHALRSWKSRVLSSTPMAPDLARPLFWLSLMGIFSGAAGAAKLNGLPLAGACAFLSLVLGGFRQGPLNLATRLAWATQIVVLPFIAVLVFILLNPFLYGDAGGKITGMANLRMNEMRSASTIPSKTVDDCAKRALLVGRRVWQDYSTMHFQHAWMFNSFFLLVGLCRLALDAWHWHKPALHREAALAIVAVAATVALPAMLTPLDWSRYFLLPVVFSSIFIALGMATILQAAQNRLVLLWPGGGRYAANNH